MEHEDYLYKSGRSKNTKKTLAVVFIMMLVLTGCSMGLIYSNQKKIASDNNSYNLDVKEQQIDEHKFTGNIEFEGMDTI